MVYLLIVEASMRRAVFHKTRLILLLVLFALAALLLAARAGTGNANPAVAPALFLGRLRLNCKVPVLY